MSVTAVVSRSGCLPTSSQTLTVTVQLGLDGRPTDPDSAAVLKLLRQLVELGEDGRSGVDPAPLTGVDHRASRPSRHLRPAQPAGRPLPDRGPGLRVHTGLRTVSRGTERIRLTRVEFDLLLFLVERPRRVFNRVQLLSAVWDRVDVGERTVDVHIRRLRAKLGSTEPLITTVRGIGYRLDERATVTVVNGG